MTLTEYFNQQTPQRMPHVVLTANEYTITKLVKYGNETRARVYINHPELGGIEYVVFKNTTNLWTTDNHGNPQNRSCFHLSEPAREQKHFCNCVEPIRDIEYVDMCGICGETIQES